MRRTPYTAIGIRRLKCFRFSACGNRAEHQWQICADGRQFRPLCLACDVALNEVVLRWMGFPDAESMIQRYRESVKLPDVGINGQP